jgi:hypothetical protein
VQRNEDQAMGDRQWAMDDGYWLPVIGYQLLVM